MKNLKNWLIALALLLPAAVQAQVVYPGSTGTVTGATIVGTAGTTETLPTVSATLVPSANPVLSGTYTGFGVTFGSAASAGSYGTGFSSATANPLVQVAVIDMKTASVNTPVAGNLLSATAGRTIYPLGGGITVTATGTAAGATNIAIVCAGGTGHTGAAFGNTVATFPVAALVSNVAVMPFMVASAVTYGSALTEGCMLGDGLTISTNGSALTTTTDLFVTIPYVVQ